MVRCLKTPSKSLYMDPAKVHCTFSILEERREMGWSFRGGELTMAVTLCEQGDCPFLVSAKRGCGAAEEYAYARGRRADEAEAAWYLPLLSCGPIMKSLFSAGASPSIFLAHVYYSVRLADKSCLKIPFADLL